MSFESRSKPPAARDTTAACPLCGPIPDQATEYYDGRGKFAPQIFLLKSHKLHRDDDFRECPKCGAFFLLENDIALTGSGDYDGLVLTRLSAGDTAVLREILHRAGRATDDPAGLAGSLLRLPDDVRYLAAIHLRERDRELARRLLPALAEHAARGDDWPRRFLKDFTTTPADAALVLSELDRHAATPGLDQLRALARATVCSICRSIATYPPTKIRLDALPPALAVLRRFGVSAHTDVWECPECDALHYWESEDGIDGGLSRVGVMEDQIRPYLHRPDTVDGKAIDSLYFSWERLAITLGMRRDPELVRSWVPHMVFRLVRESERWLHDALCELARDPATAASVLAWIAKLQRTNALVESLAAHARATMTMPSVPAITTYAALANEYPRLTEALRAASATEAAALTDSLERKARDLLAPLDHEMLAKVAAWHTDHFYSLLHALSFLDRASLAFAHAIGVALCAALTKAGVSVASLVDNEIPHDRLVPLKALFNSLGFVVASPELLAQELAAHDGLVVDDVRGPHLPSYLAEATALAMRLFEEALAKRLPVLWVSGATELETYMYLARLLEEMPYIGIFRNQLPDLEQAVQLFQTPTHRIALDPNY